MSITAEKQKQTRAVTEKSYKNNASFLKQQTSFDIERKQKSFWLFDFYKENKQKNTLFL